VSDHDRRDKQLARNKGKFLVGFLAIAGALALLALVGNKMYPSGEQYARDSGLAILNVHSEKELQSVLLQRLSPEAQKGITKAWIADTVELLNALGKAKDDKGVELVQIQSGPLNHSEGVGSKNAYTASAVFENGTGIVHMTLVRHGDGWQINDFDVAILEREVAQ
jgi:hypothetical protein